jgi:hypothetical protein
MAQEQRRAGIIQVQFDGEIQDAAGEWSYNPGSPKREALVGADRVHGFKETPQVPFIEGVIRDRSDLDLNRLTRIEKATITLQLANGKVFVLRNAWHAGEGTANTGEATIPVRFEGESGEEVR